MDTNYLKKNLSVYIVNKSGTYIILEVDSFSSFESCKRIRITFKEFSNQGNRTQVDETHRHSTAFVITVNNDFLVE